MLDVSKCFVFEGVASSSCSYFSLSRKREATPFTSMHKDMYCYWFVLSTLLLISGLHIY